MDANKGANFAQALKLAKLCAPYDLSVPNGGRVEFHWQGWKCVEATFDNAPNPIKGSLVLPTAPELGFTPKSGILDLAVD